MLKIFRLITIKLLIISALIPSNSKAVEAGIERIPFYKTSAVDSNTLEEYNLASFKNKVVVVMFFATWCHFCEQQMPVFSLLKKSYEDNPNVVFLPISIDENPIEKLPGFLESSNISNLETYFDSKKQLFSAFGLYAVPSLVLISQKGDIMGSYAGIKKLDQDLLSKLANESLTNNKIEKIDSENEVKPQ